MKLYVYVSRAGGLKKKEAKKMVASGTVLVNGQCVTDPHLSLVLGVGTKVSVVTSPSMPLQEPFHRLYVMYKPQRCVCMRERRHDSWLTARGLAYGNIDACQDKSFLDGGPKLHHRTVFDLIPSEFMHSEIGVFGRLDRDTTGVLLLGSDGGLQAALLDPLMKVPRSYIADLDPSKTLHPGAIDILANGATLADGHVCLPAKLEVLAVSTTNGNASQVRLTVVEGKYHEVKRLLGLVGGCVTKLHRESFAEHVRVDGMEPGDVRHATLEELRALAAALSAPLV